MSSCEELFYYKKIPSALVYCDLEKTILSVIRFLTMRFLKFVLLFLIVLPVCKLHAQTNFWRSIDGSRNANIFELSEDFTHRLLDVEKGEYVSVSIPNTHENFETFDITLSGVMSDGLKKKYPEIKTYSGESESGERLSITLNPKGLFFMFTHNEHYEVINPQENGWYKVSLKIDGDEENDFNESLRLKPKSIVTQARTAAMDKYPTGEVLRKFRIAIAATGEYTSYHGGTKSDALSAIVTTINRVNQIFEKDLSISLELVSNTDDVIYTNSVSDPFSNNDAGSLIDEAHNTIISVIGSANFDIGHVFSTGGGGLATLGSVCYSAYKGQGVTGSSAPIGDEYDIDYVAHELGHQFGAEHSFNGTVGSCQGNISSNAYEPGSGSTIMGYAGICGTHNVANKSSAYFHITSIEQIQSFVESEGACYESVDNTNTQPLINAGVGGFTIPANTPFELTAEGSDADGDNITYCWEQFDLGESGHPNLPGNSSPLFRSFDPTTNPTRVFPQISDILSGTQTKGEILPDETRTLTFKSTIRDGKGGVNSDEISFEVSALAGPFLVNDVVGSKEGLSYIDVSWDVAGTNSAPIYCDNVSIYLSIDGGYTFDYLLDDNVPNNGLASVLLPNVISTQARIKVSGNSNAFFNINDSDFEIIEATAPSYVFVTDRDELTYCETGDTLELEVYTLASGGFSDVVYLDLISDEQITYFSFSKDSIYNDEVTLLKIVLADTVSQDFSFELEGTSSVYNSVDIGVKVQNGVLETLELTSPITLYQSNYDAQIPFSWTSTGVNSFRLNVNEYVTGNSVINQVLSEASFDASSILEEGTLYTLHVNGVNTCLDEVSTDTIVFSVLRENCEFADPIDLPLNIGVSFSPVVVNSYTSISDLGTIKKVRLNAIKGTHEYVGDLEFALQSPTGTEVVLLSEECSSDDDFDFNIDDKGAGVTCPLNDGKSYSSVDPLSSFNGENADGIWKLVVTDLFETEDGGTLESWQLEVCGTNYLTNEEPELVTNLYNWGNEEEVIISRYFTVVSDADGHSVRDLNYHILSLPHGFLKLNGVLLSIGGTFDQADINNDVVTYETNLGANALDSFQVFVDDGYGGIVEPFYVYLNIDSLFNAIEDPISARLLVSPNPVVNTLRVFFEENFQGELYVYSAFGQLMFLELVKASEHIDVEMSQLPSGVYIVIARNEFGVEKRVSIVKD